MAQLKVFTPQIYQPQPQVNQETSPEIPLRSGTEEYYRSFGMRPDNQIPLPAAQFQFQERLASSNSVPVAKRASQNILPVTKKYQEQGNQRSAQKEPFVSKVSHQNHLTVLDPYHKHQEYHDDNTPKPQIASVNN